MENLDEKIKKSETRIFKVVFPKILNHHETMFGGAIMENMTETAFITATRFARKKIVVVAAEQVKFQKPVEKNALVEFLGRVKSVGNTSLKVEVEVFQEEMYSEKRERCAVGIFSLVALDEKGNSTPIF